MARQFAECEGSVRAQTGVMYIVLMTRFILAPFLIDFNHFLFQPRSFAKKTNK